MHPPPPDGCMMTQRIFDKYQLESNKLPNTVIGKLNCLHSDTHKAYLFSGSKVNGSIRVYAVSASDSSYFLLHFCTIFSENISYILGTKVNGYFT